MTRNPRIARRHLLVGAAALAGASALPLPSRAQAASRTFVLVHGAWHGGWCWRRVADRLTARGHRVFAPTLTGLGERSHLLTTQIDLSAHVTDIVNVCKWEDASDFVLCGHSYGGLVATGVAAALPGKIASLVMVDAFVPEAGKSLLDYLPPQMLKSTEDRAAQNNGYLPPVPAKVFKVNEADQAWVDAKCTPQPVATFREPAGPTEARDRIPRKAYVFAAGYDSPVFGEFSRKLRQDPAWKSYEIAEGGHDLMVDAPERLTEILLEAAG